MRHEIPETVPATKRDDAVYVDDQSQNDTSENGCRSFHDADRFFPLKCTENPPSGFSFVPSRLEEHRLTATRLKAAENHRVWRCWYSYKEPAGTP